MTFKIISMLLDGELVKTTFKKISKKQKQVTSAGTKITCNSLLQCQYISRTRSCRITELTSTKPYMLAHRDHTNMGGTSVLICKVKHKPWDIRAFLY